MAELEWQSTTPEQAAEFAPVSPERAASEVPAEPLPETNASIEQASIEDSIVSQLEEVPTTPSEEPSERIKQLQEAFKKELGVDVSEAIGNMNKFNEASRQVLDSIKQAEANLALRLQELELKTAWAKEPSVQDIEATYQQRLQEATAAYNRLSPEVQQRVAQMGAKGVQLVWNQIQQNRRPVAELTIPTSGQADIADNQTNLSELVAIKDDDEFYRALQNIRNSKRRVRNDL